MVSCDSVIAMITSQGILFVSAEPQAPTEDASEMFLDIVRIFLACGTDELRPLVLACRAGAATRYDTLQPCLTHILVGLPIQRSPPDYNKHEHIHLLCI